MCMGDQIVWSVWLSGSLGRDLEYISSATLPHLDGAVSLKSAWCNYRLGRMCWNGKHHVAMSISSILITRPALNLLNYLRTPSQSPSMTLTTKQTQANSPDMSCPMTLNRYNEYRCMSVELEAAIRMEFIKSTSRYHGNRQSKRPTLHVWQIYDICPGNSCCGAKMNVR